MAAVILNVKQDIDTSIFDLSDWLQLAMSETDGREYLKIRHGNMATDGVRIHADDYDNDCVCGNPQDIHGKINHIMELSEKDCNFAFWVDRQLLIDALAGMPDGTIVIYHGKYNQPIVIEEHDGCRFAVLMPMAPYEGNLPTHPHLPRVNNPKPPQPDDSLFEI
jgi:hypothetical protein